ncbi:oxygen-insensitive NADPH nitroreductase [Enterovibrio sp. ZSDZ35]|uniref:Oxygen-insensitive NADPH nitroreductase n=1 Tax=Enterovibrio qingdaonensis TaxID=2899818 RepID=A0ABT5QQS9_9GAMM|nr:oxygen-insensitive NADPH nitroreductase [Enterovibrio sp. ZSDZ35]MDD1783342.1 oxygen-insensitive NADPH nitroreductase [Enterovibrio sp. ZSDZ35]
MNPVIDTLLAHRSIRKFQDKALTEDQVTTVIDCARAASSSSFIQCTSIIRVIDKEKRRLLAEYAGNQAYVADAAEFFVWCLDFNRHLQIKPDAQLGFTEQTLIGAIDTALMAQNALAAAESMGLGGVYIGGIRNNPDKVSELLNLPEYVAPLFGLCLGYPAQDPEVKPRLPSSLLVHTDEYQPLDKDELAKYDEEVRHYYRTRTGGTKEMTWSEQIDGTLGKESRPFMKAFIESKGLSVK